MRMFHHTRQALAGILLVGSLVPSVPAFAANVHLSFANIGATNGPAFSPFFVAFHDGTFDPFDLNTPASGAIKAIAEAGNGAGLAAALGASQPDAIGTTVTATVNGFGPGIFLPGSSGGVTVDLDPVKHRYLSYFSMLVPSNDRFFGNDSPTEIELFDSNGQLLTGMFEDKGSAVWDAGTEVDGLTGAAFIVGSNAGDSPAQNGVITANHDFSVYANATTPAGYTFSALPGTNSPLLRVHVSAVPLPGGVWLLGSALGALGWFRRRQLSVH